MTARLPMATPTPRQQEILDELHDYDGDEDAFVAVAMKLPEFDAEGSEAARSLGFGAWFALRDGSLIVRDGVRAQWIVLDR